MQGSSRLLSRLINNNSLPNGQETSEQEVVDSAEMDYTRKLWGMLPQLSVVTAFGVLLVAFAYNLGRQNHNDMGHILYWIGILTIYLPITARLIGDSAKRNERIGLVIILGLSLYLVKVMYSPLEFEFSDELQQWRSTIDILKTGHLFQQNPILPVSPYYPGLQNITTCLMYFTGWSIFEAGQVVIGIARVILSVALYMFYEQLSHSPRVSSIAAMIYMTNPFFLFWTSYFIYQSLALPLSVVVLYFIVRLARKRGGPRIAMRLVILLILGAIVITHHITSFFLITVFIIWITLVIPFSAMWVILRWYERRYTLKQVFPTFFKLVAKLYYKPSLRLYYTLPWREVVAIGVITLIWITFIARITVDYLEPQITNVISEFIQVVSGNISSETVFVTPDRPGSELMFGIFSILLLLAGLLLGYWYIWKYHRRHFLYFLMILGSCMYGISIGLRFVSPRGGELAGRMWPFVYIMVGLVVAVGFVEVRHIRIRKRIKFFCLIVISAIIFIGGLMNGWPPYWGRIPGPFLVGASERSIEPEGKSAADWANNELSPGNQIMGDYTVYHLMAAYGNQSPVATTALIEAYFMPTLTEDVINAIKYVDLDYLVIDNRLSLSIPERGFAFQPWENDRNPRKEHPTTGALKKFNRLDHVGRVFDSGEIVIYDVAGIN